MIVCTSTLKPTLINLTSIKESNTLVIDIILYNYTHLPPLCIKIIMFFTAQLEKQRRMDVQQKRCQSALVQPGQKFARPVKSATTRSEMPESAVTTQSFKPTSSTTKSDKPLSATFKTEIRTLQSTPSRLDNRPATTPAASRLRTLSPIRSVSPEKMVPSPMTAPGM